MFNSLPEELLREVFAYVCMTFKAVNTGLSFPQVHNKTHLLTLSRVSKRFRSHVFPRLFEVLTIKPNDETRLWDLKSHPYFAQDTIVRVPKVLAVVKELHFSAPFESRDLSKFEYLGRCPHSRIQHPNQSSYDSLGSEYGSYVSHEDAGAFMRKQEAPKWMEDLVDGEHRNYFDGEHRNYGLINLAIKTARLLSALPDDQLVSFR